MLLRIPPPALAWLAGVLPVVVSAASSSRPNLLYVFADDQSYRSISCYGNKAWSWVRTPNIDQLAADGVRFEHAFAGSWCVPSRATMLTGLQPHGMEGFRPAKREFDPAACRFWPESLRQAGYTTAFIGKWHIKGYGGQKLWRRDWDHWVAWDHTREDNGGYYGEKSKDGTQLLNRDGRDEWVPGYPTDNYTRFALDFIRRQAGQRQPWYLWLCYGASHAPYLVPERHRDRYSDAPVPVPADVFGPRPDKPDVMRDFTMFVRGPKPGDSPRYETDYLDASLEECVRMQNRTTCAIDEGVGQIVAALRETEQLENTVVVYASDDGFPWGEQGFANKNGPYDACQRTPLIVRWPAGVARGAVCARPVGQIDLVPTFLALAGVDAPWEMHGHDLRPLLKDPTAAWPHPVLLEYFNEEFGSDSALPTPEKTKRARSWEPPGWWISLRHDRYTYIRWIVADEIEELYDLDADPQQLKNLAVDRDHRRTVEHFRTWTEAELRRTHAGIVEQLPKVRMAPPP